MYAFDSDKLAKAVTIAVAAVRLVMLLNEGTEGMGYKFLLCIIYSIYLLCAGPCDPLLIL